MKESLLKLNYETATVQDVYRALGNGAYINVQDTDGNTPLMLAVKHSYPDIVKVLISNEAYINVQDKYGKTALTYAVEKNNPDMVKILIDNGAEFKNNNPDIVNELIDKNTEFKREGLLKLDYNIATVQDVLEALDNGANINAKTKKCGYTPLLLAVKHNYPDMVQVMIDNGAYINVQDKDGNTGLIYAARDNNSDMVKVLVANGADVDVQNKGGNTALMYADDNPELLKEKEKEKEAPKEKRPSEGLILLDIFRETKRDTKKTVNSFRKLRGQEPLK